jgi:cytochrome P450
MSISAPPGAPSPPAPFNPISQQFLNDPEAFLAVARKDAPVFFSSDFGFWAVTRFADIDRILSDHETFSSNSLAQVPVPDEYADRVPPGFFATGALVSQDPPKHTTRRKLINRGFTRGKMAAMVAPIEQLCHDLIDGFAHERRIDLMTRYCYEVSLRSIVQLMGLPSDDLPRLRQLADDQGAVVSDQIKPMGHAERLERWERIVGARSYLAAIADDRRAHPADDLISTMIQATDENGAPALTTDQVVTHLTELVFAGTDTTSNLMGALVRLLDVHPAVLGELRVDPELWPSAVEEALRIRSAAAGLFRITTRDVEVSGVTIPSGQIVWVGVLSAGHDAAVFADPARFDIHRNNVSEHLSFGKGRHFCLGAPLTRVEAPIGMRVLYERLPDLKVVPEQDFEYDPVLVAVILKHMEVMW